MNDRLDALLVQMKSMNLTQDELVKLTEQYADSKTQTGVLIHTGAMMLAAKGAFSQ